MVTCGTSKSAPACGSLPTGSPVSGVNSSQSDNLINYKLGVLYKPVAYGSIYANFAVSAQPPGGGSLSLSSAANSADNPIFASQKARTTEVGTKWDLLGERLLLTGALYRTIVSNDVVQDPVDLVVPQGEMKLQLISPAVRGALP